MFGNYKLNGLYKKNVDLFNFKNGINGRIDGHIAKNTLAEISYNFDYSDGALKCGVGIKQLEFLANGNHYVCNLPEGLIPKKVFFYQRQNPTTLNRDDRILVLFHDGSVYEWKIYGQSTNMVQILGLTFEEVPFYVNYRLNDEDTIMFSTDGVLYVYNGETVNTFDAPKITSMCIHNERLFATTENNSTNLWFSTTFDPTNWEVSLDQAGFIDLRTKQGGLLKVLSFNGYLYAFANYGIYRVTAYNNQLEMNAESLYVNSGRIIGSSVTLCGKNVIYLAEDGFYKFNGTSSYRIMTELDKYIVGINNEDLTSAYHNGKFYSSLNLNIGGETCKMMICLDMVTNEFYLCKGINAYDMETIDGEGFSVLSILSEGYNQIATISKDGAKFGIPLTKIWKSYKNDFNLSGEKTLSYISLYTKSRIQVEISSDYGVRTVEFNGESFRQRKEVGLKGNSFTITIKSRSQNAEISKVVLELQYL